MELLIIGIVLWYMVGYISYAIALRNISGYLTITDLFVCVLAGLGGIICVLFIIDSVDGEKKFFIKK